MDDLQLFECFFNNFVITQHIFLSFTCEIKSLFLGIEVRLFPTNLNRKSTANGGNF